MCFGAIGAVPTWKYNSSMATTTSSNMDRETFERHTPVYARPRKPLKKRKNKNTPPPTVAHSLGHTTRPLSASSLCLFPIASMYTDGSASPQHQDSVVEEPYKQREFAGTGEQASNGSPNGNPYTQEQAHKQTHMDTHIGLLCHPHTAASTGRPEARAS